MHGPIRVYSPNVAVGQRARVQERNHERVLGPGRHEAPFWHALEACGTVWSRTDSPRNAKDPGDHLTGCVESRPDLLVVVPSSG